VVDIRWWDTALRVFKMHGLVQGVYSPLAVWDALHLKPTAPPELVQAAYKCLARIHHPDHGGDNESMRRLNAAYDRVRQNHG
jgi:DnaJ-class molecular chaperone